MTASFDTAPAAFRADIEGLRAVAILLVVAAHAHLPGFDGGFVGVDVFFVLSGFLITGLLAKEIDIRGRIDLLNFYARRAKRLFPALLAMLLVTSIAASVLLPPSQHADQARAAGSAAMWLSNLYFAAAGLDYFGMQAEDSLFLHTWSLGVEEQFYTAWPATIMFLLGAWRWQGAQRNTRHLDIGLWVLLVASLLGCVLLAAQHARLTFYLTPFRVWEFALGGLLALRNPTALPGGASGVHVARIGIARTAAGLAGMSAIVGSVILIDKHTPYPYLWALLPALGAAAVIFSGMGGAGGAMTRTLACTPLRAIGRVSYSWYLWHWPVFILGAIFLPNPSILGAMTLVVVSLGVAAFFYVAIEAPLRRSRLMARHPAWTLATSVGLLASVWVGSGYWADASTVWSEQGSQRQYQLVRGNKSDLYQRGCDDWFHSDRLKPCEFGDPAAPRTAVLIGDSIGAQWFPALQSIYTRGGWKLTVITKSACPIVDVPYFYPAVGRVYAECDRWREKALAHVAAMQPDVVILGSANIYPFSREQWIEGTAAVLQRLHPNARSVAILRATPALPFDGPGCLSGKAWRPKILQQFTSCEVESSSRHNDEVHGWQRVAARRFGDVRLLDLNELVCRGGVCAAEVDGQVVFRDAQHLADAFVASLETSVAAELNR